MSRKGPHQYSYDNIRIHPLMIYSDIIEYIIVSDKNFLYFVVFVYFF